MIPNGQWMRSVPNENPVFSQAFQRGASYPIWTIVTVVNYVRATGSLTKKTLGYAAMPAAYFFVYLYPSLKDATNLALDSMLDVALDAPPLRWICPIDDGFNPFDGIDMRFLGRRADADLDVLLGHDPLDIGLAGDAVPNSRRHN